MPLPTLNWEWAKNSEIQIIVLTPIIPAVLPVKFWYQEVVTAQDRELEKILGPVSYKIPTGLFSGDMDLDIDTRVKMEPVTLDSLVKPVLVWKEMKDKLKDVETFQKAETFQRAIRPQSRIQSKSNPVPQIAIKKEPELADMDMDFSKMTRDIYGDDMSQSQSIGVRISTPELETLGMADIE